MNSSPLASSLALEQHPNVQQALQFGEKYLWDVRRQSGENYFVHGTEVAHTLQEVVDDPTLIAVAVLHDLPVHPLGPKLLADAPLDEKQRELVHSMQGLRQLHIDLNTKDLDKVLGAFTHDARLLLLRMAHRLNDVRHLGRFEKKRRQEIAHETLHMYTAISGRLGFHRWRWQMEDICFLELQPRIAKKVQQQFEAFQKMDEMCLQHTRLFLHERLGDAGIEAVIDQRIKGIYSSYRKMTLKKRSFEELADRLALRVIVDDVDECYRALGVIHSCMRPMHGKLKDYIGTPKENGYRSIHTVVYPLPGVSQLPMEIQIRTRVMHRECEFGIASHGKYKDWAYSLNTPQTRVNLFRNLENLHTLASSDLSFTDALRHSFNDNRLLIFDAYNNVYHINKPATALDFACQLHPDECRLIRGVRINGRKQELDTVLREGDAVEVEIGEKPLPMKGLLNATQRKATKELIRKAWKDKGEIAIR